MAPIRPAVASALAVGVIAASIALLGASAQVQLEDDIAGKARGAYDILVRPSGGARTATTQGLVEPNFLAFGGSGGISLTQLGQVRAIPDVAVAAPISVIGQVTGGWVTPSVALPPSSTTAVYRFTITQRVSDGVSDRIVSQQTFGSLLPGKTSGEAASTGVAGAVGGDASTGWYVPGLPLPPVSSSIVAVEPQAEAALVGHPVAALAELDAVRGGQTGTFDGQTIQAAIGSAIKHKVLSNNSALASAAVPAGASAVVPVVVTDRDPSSGSLQITAELLAEGAVVDAALKTEAAGTVLESWQDSTKPLKVVRDQMAADLRPLGAANSTFRLWGASQDGPSGGLLPQADGLLIDRPSYQPVATTTGEQHLRIMPTGLVPMTGPKVELRGQSGSGLGEAKTPGSDQSYRKAEAIGLANDVAYFPISSFVAKDLVPTSPDEGRVGLGAYDVPPMTITSSTLAAPGTTIQPTLNTAGLVVRPPVAIADLRDAELLRGPTPIDAIRVRVAGVDRVDDAAARRVQEVATQIANLGLDVDVVIGSSPQEVAIDVPEYVVGAGETTADLGTLAQRWTTLGAATTVGRGLSHTTLSLLAMAAVTALVATIAAHLLEASSSSRDAAILALTGWSRGAVRRRFVAAPLAAGMLGLLTIVVVWLLGARDPVVGAIALGLGLLSPVATIASSWWATTSASIGASRAGDTAAGSPRLPVRSPATLGRRLVSVTPARTVALAALLATTCAVSGLAVVIFAGRAKASGPTLLGAALTYSLTSLHLAMLLVLLATGLGFAIWLWRFQVTRARSRDHALLVAGWSRSELRRLWLATLAWICLPASVLGGGTAGILAGGADVPDPVLGAATGLATGLALALAMAATAWPARLQKEGSS